MRKCLLAFFLLLCFVSVPFSLSAQTLRWRPDSLVVSHHVCDTITRSFAATLYNITDSAVTVDQFGISATGWNLEQAPPGWTGFGNRIARGDSASFIFRYQSRPMMLGYDGAIFVVDPENNIANLALRVHK